VRFLQYPSGDHASGGQRRPEADGGNGSITSRKIDVKRAYLRPPSGWPVAGGRESEWRE
jgi:hypothetical protein